MYGVQMCVEMNEECVCVCVCVCGRQVVYQQYQNTHHSEILEQSPTVPADITID